MEEKKFLSLEGLQNYHSKITNKIDTDINAAKNYTDEEVAKKTVVQFCVWEETD